MKSEGKDKYLCLYVINGKHQITEAKKNIERRTNKFNIVEYKMALENKGFGTAFQQEDCGSYKKVKLKS